MSEPRPWFHWHGGVFFRRADDGAVEIGHGPGFEDVHVDHSIDANSWASIVSSVSARGENHVTFYEALELHNTVLQARRIVGWDLAAGLVATVRAWLGAARLS